MGLKWVVQQGRPLATAVWRRGFMLADLDLWSWGNLTSREMAQLSALCRARHRRRRRRRRCIRLESVDTMTTIITDTILVDPVRRLTPAVSRLDFAEDRIDEHSLLHPPRPSGRHFPGLVPQSEIRTLNHTALQ